MSAPEDTFDRLGEAWRAGSDDAWSREDCPTAEHIWAAVHMELTPDARRVVIDHIGECSACAEAWGLAMEMGRSAGMQQPSPSRVSAVIRSPRTWVAMAAAATLVIAAVLLRPSPPPDEAVIRGGDQRLPRSQLADGMALPRNDFHLRWSGGPTGTRYDLTVTTSNLDVIILARGLESAEYRVPPERLANVSPDSRVLWRVVARTPDGRTFASPTFEALVK